MLKYATDISKIKVRVNADNAYDIEEARKLSINNVGLCRSEHMFFEKHKLRTLQKAILIDNAILQQYYLEDLFKIQKQDFIEIFKASKGDKVNIRLLDPPMHEFLPSKSSTDNLINQLNEEEILNLISNNKLPNNDVIEIVKDIVLDHINGNVPKKYIIDNDFKLIDSNLDINKYIKFFNKTKSQIENKISDLNESNPMLGYRGARLGLIEQNIYNTQIKALKAAVLDVFESDNIKQHLEIMVPFICFENEIKSITNIIRDHFKDVNIKQEVCNFKVGAMIELPRACFIADKIAHHVDFLSFGTNDLTQTMLGISRDDSAKFLDQYQKNNIILNNPFLSIDEDSVGLVMKIAIKKARSVKQDISIGVCGEHGGDYSSIQFCKKIGVDYVSCSKTKLITAIIASAQIENN
ncbi:MAG TPA: hypothetical protein QKA14_02665 [Candidatus Megaira endosymbiont of Hartmannula sinica]|nr:hypothetical protein [Candidatus Megaera endosymbiont of Hartmannula sinica]